VPLEPQIAEDLLGLMEGHSELTDVQRSIIKLAATMLVEDAHPGKEIDDPRLKLAGRECEGLTGPFEVLDGIARPKDWATPNLIAYADRSNQRFDELMAQGLSTGAAMAQMKSEGL
jgi:hypothetical protein